jgi:hypothetical protein
MAPILPKPKKASSGLPPSSEPPAPFSNEELLEPGLDSVPLSYFVKGWCDAKGELLPAMRTLFAAAQAVRFRRQGVAPGELLDLLIAVDAIVAPRFSGSFAAPIDVALREALIDRKPRANEPAAITTWMHDVAPTFVRFADLRAFVLHVRAIYDYLVLDRRIEATAPPRPIGPNDPTAVPLHDVSTMERFLLEANPVQRLLSEALREDENG